LDSGSACPVGTGALGQETGWLGDIPVATLQPIGALFEWF